MSHHLDAARRCLLESLLELHRGDSDAVHAACDWVNRAWFHVYSLRTELGRPSEPVGNLPPATAGLLSDGRPVVPEEGQR